MYTIKNKRFLTDNIYLMDVVAPRVAKSALPGQFIILRTTEKGERVPLTIADYNKEEGTVTIVVQIVGKTTLELSKLNVGDAIADFVGPLGKPSDLVTDDFEEVSKKRVLFIAGGVGTAPVYPQVKWMKERGLDADVIIGARDKSLIILEEETKKVAKNLYVCTDNGSYGYNGRVTDMLNELVKNQGKKYDHCVIIGPMIMMKFAAMLTKELNIPTIVSLNPIMVDGTGMCGACRVSVGGETKFACVDGPEFDGHLVNYDEAMRRQAMYKTEEGKAMLKYKEGSSHRNGSCGCGGSK